MTLAELELQMATVRPQQPMTYTAGIYSFESDARRLRTDLAAAGIASVVRITIGGVHLVFVARKDGKRAEVIRKEAR